MRDGPTLSSKDPCDYEFGSEYPTSVWSGEGGFSTHSNPFNVAGYRVKYYATLEQGKGWTVHAHQADKIDLNRETFIFGRNFYGLRIYAQTVVISPHGYMRSRAPETFEALSGHLLEVDIQLNNCGVSLINVRVLGSDPIGCGDDPMDDEQGADFTVHGGESAHKKLRADDNDDPMDD